MVKSDRDYGAGAAIDRYLHSFPEFKIQRVIYWVFHNLCQF